LFSCYDKAHNLFEYKENIMRSPDEDRGTILYAFIPDKFVPQDHPLRPIRDMADKALYELHSEFSKMYSHTGRPGIAPEKLLKALLIQALYSIRSNRLLMEEISYSILFRWFLDISVDERVWDHSTFSRNQQRFLRSDIAGKFFSKVIGQAKTAGLLSDERFTVDGTLIESWASLKSFRPKDDPPSSPQGRNEDVNYRGQKRKNDTHVSTTDPQSKLFRKGNNVAAKLYYTGNVLMENRNGLIMDTELMPSTGTAERDAGIAMLKRLTRNKRISLGADKLFDTKEFIAKLRAMKITPHVAQNSTNRKSAIDGRTTCHPNYRISQRVRKRIEEVFGWIKTIGTMRKTRYVGTEKVGWHFKFVAAAYNLVRMRKLLYTA
jgi:transposase